MILSSYEGAFRLEEARQRKDSANANPSPTGAQNIYTVANCKLETELLTPAGLSRSLERIRHCSQVYLNDSLPCGVSGDTEKHRPEAIK